MIDAKKAVQNAQEYLNTVFGNASFRNLLLEEVELSEDRKFWYITLSYTSADVYLPLYPIPKDYKIFKISSGTGEVLSMKIRVMK